MNVKKLMKEYQGIQVDTTVEQAGPHKLVSLLMNGALEKLIRAKASNDAVLRRELVGKSISIIDSFFVQQVEIPMGFVLF